MNNTIDKNSGTSEFYKKSANIKFSKGVDKKNYKEGYINNFYLKHYFLSTFLYEI